MNHYSESDMGDMSGYDPNAGLGKRGYAKAISAHIDMINKHLQSVGMNGQSAGAKAVADGIHKAAMERMFSPQNANSTAPLATAPGGFMRRH